MSKETRRIIWVFVALCFVVFVVLLHFSADNVVVGRICRFFGGMTIGALLVMAVGTLLMLLWQAVANRKRSR